jgi:cytochrome c oxidase subunit 2
MNHEPTVQMPGQWSTFAPNVDFIFYFIYWMSVILFVGIIGAALYFVWKYQRKPGVKAEPTGHNLPLEVGWTVAPVFFLALLFHWGFRGYTDLTVSPANAMEIRVRGRKWSWDFEYPNGAHETNTLHVPVNRPVRLVLSSDDVIHSFFVPAFRVKRDAVPGMYSMMWFQATHEGTTNYFCAEYCGAAETASRGEHGEEVFSGHFSMNGHVVVDNDARFAAHLEEINGPPIVNGQPVTPVQWGALLYRSSQCYTCHSVDGAAGTGPTWQHMVGHPVTLTDGTTVEVDTNYLRESILNPQAKVVRGFQPVMPTYRGSLNDRQIDALIAYMQSLQ